MRRAAGHGSDEAMFNLGVIYFHSGAEDVARGWWENAAAAGNLQAIHNLGLLLARERAESPVDGDDVAGAGADDGVGDSPTSSLGVGDLTGTQLPE